MLRVGHSFRLEAYARYGPQGQPHFALPFASTATASVPMANLGVLGLDPTQLIGLPSFLVTQPVGFGGIDLPAPNLPSLVAQPVHLQVVLIPFPDLSAARLTNIVSEVVHR